MFHAGLLKKTSQLYELNKQLNFLFHDQRFCHARSGENMARQVYLHRRPLVRCTFFRILSQKDTRIMNLKNPEKNPLELWILWIYGPALDFSNKTQHPFSDSRIRIWIFPKKRTLILHIIIQNLVHLDV